MFDNANNLENIEKNILLKLIKINRFQNSKIIFICHSLSSKFQHIEKLIFYTENVFFLYFPNYKDNELVELINNKYFKYKSKSSIFNHKI